MYDSIFCDKLLDLENALGCSEAEAIGILGIIWLWARDRADENGLLVKTSERHLKRQLFDKTANEDLDAVVDALFQTGWLDRDGDKIYVHDYGEWQRPWFQRQNRLKKDREYHQERRNYVEEEPPNLFGEALPEPDTFVDDEEPQKAPPVQSYSPTFQKIWEIYPRKKEKKAAYKAYQARIREGWRKEDLLEATRRYAEDMTGKEERHIKHGSTFFGPNTPFTDYLPSTTEDTTIVEEEHTNPFWEYGEAK